MTDAEKNYAVIEKEALAATWACEKFSDYILGIPFTLETDHRSLVPLLSSKDLSKLPARILRFGLRLMRYSPKVKYLQGIHQNTADALSRAPVLKPTKNDVIFINETEEFTDLPATDRRLDEFRDAQIGDAICTQIKDYVNEGWPPIMPNLPLLKPYWQHAAHFTMNNGLIMYDSRLVVPQSIQLSILEKIHAGHLGMSKCKGRAQLSVWWPGITSQIEAMCNKCRECLLHRAERKEPLLVMVPPDSIWDRVGTDLFEYNKKRLCSGSRLCFQMARLQRAVYHNITSCHQSSL